MTTMVIEVLQVHCSSALLRPLDCCVVLLIERAVGCKPSRACAATGQHERMLASA
jgi:hypothetical protein